MSVSGILFVSAAAPSTGAAPPPVSADPAFAGVELARAVAAADRSGPPADAGIGSGAGSGGRAGTPVSAPATRPEFAVVAPEVAPAIEIPLMRAWRMADVMAAIGGGPRAERLIELANRPGPVQPGSLLEAIKRLRVAPPPASSRAV
jgi:hypothetical protein